TTTTTTTAAPTTTTEPGPGQCPTVPPRAQPRPDRTNYHLTVNVDLDHNTVTGTVDATVTPDLATDRPPFRLCPSVPVLARAGPRRPRRDGDHPGGRLHRHHHRAGPPAGAGHRRAGRQGHLVGAGGRRLRHDPRPFHRSDRGGARPRCRERDGRGAGRRQG